MSEEKCTCQWKKQHTACGIGKTYRTYCGKIAVGQSPTDTRMLCQEHINRVVLKHKVAKLRIETGMNKTTLKLKGLI